MLFVVCFQWSVCLSRIVTHYVLLHCSLNLSLDSANLVPRLSPIFSFGDVMEREAGNDVVIRL